MAIRLKHISGALVIAAAVVGIAPASWAQEVTVTPPQTIPSAFDDLVSNYSGTYFDNRTISRQWQRIVGFGFPEHEMDWDANATTTAFYDLMRLQTTIDPTLRVPDLANPYSSSLLTMPSGQSPSVGTEFIFERF